MALSIANGEGRHIIFLKNPKAFIQVCLDYESMRFKRAFPVNTIKTGIRRGDCLLLRQCDADQDFHLALLLPSIPSSHAIMDRRRDRCGLQYGRDIRRCLPVYSAV